MLFSGGTFFFFAASALTAWNISPNAIGILILAISFFLYRRTVRLDFPRALAVYVGVCTIETFPVHFGNIADMYFKSDAEGMTFQGCAVLLACSCLMLAAFVHPAREQFPKAVDELDTTKLWYSTTVISAIFLVFNILAIPTSYDVVRNSRLRFLYPLFEVCALVLLITVYVLFYGIVTDIAEQVKLEKYSQLLEMQSHQFRNLQEYMKLTERLRHDFKHSVHILVSLAEKGDLDSIRMYLSEYEQHFAESVIVGYCKNSALNALFGNIIENAIYACAALPEGQRYFSLASEIRHGNSLYIVSTNSFDGKTLKDKDGKYLSTKHSGQGTGLSSIAAAEKYGGSANFYNSSKEFYADVVLKV